MRDLGSINDLLDLVGSGLDDIGEQQHDHDQHQHQSVALPP